MRSLNMVAFANAALPPAVAAVPNSTDAGAQCIPCDATGSLSDGTICRACNGRGWCEPKDTRDPAEVIRLLESSVDRYREIARDAEKRAETAERDARILAAEIGTHVERAIEGRHARDLDEWYRADHAASAVACAQALERHGYTARIRFERDADEKIIGLRVAIMVRVDVETV